jgi:hypothetical protein
MWTSRAFHLTYFCQKLYPSAISFGCRDRWSTWAGGKQRIGSDYWHWLLLDSLGPDLWLYLETALLSLNSVCHFSLLSCVSVQAKVLAENRRHSQRVNRVSLMKKLSAGVWTALSEDGDVSRGWQQREAITLWGHQDLVRGVA